MAPAMGIRAPLGTCSSFWKHSIYQLQFKIIIVLELLSWSNNERKAENVENDKQDILKIKGSIITNDNLHHISPLKVSKGSVCVSLSVTFSEN